MSLFACSAYQHSNLRDSQKLFHLRNIQKDVTVTSDLDKRIEKRCFHEGQFGISR